MERWVDFSAGRSRDLILNGGVGDHLAPVRTPTAVVDTAYFANSAHLVARAAALLGKTDDAAKYDKLFHDITAAFNQTFVATNGVIQGDTQTGYILALQFGLLPENLRAIAAQRLAEDVTQHGHVTGGFVGNGLICPTLSLIGRPDLAWDLVLTNTYPSWLFSVKNGATTIWERWDGWTPERGFQDSSMNSFNHYSLVPSARGFTPARRASSPMKRAPAINIFSWLRNSPPGLLMRKQRLIRPTASLHRAGALRKTGSFMTSRFRRTVPRR